MPRSHLARILVTGASGTLGYNIVRHLAAKHPLTRLQILLRKPDQELFAEFPNVGQQRADLADLPRFTEATLDFQPNAIIHCAATGVRPSRISWFEVIERNVTATLELFRASAEIPDCHFLHISTGLVYDAHALDRPCHEGDPVDTLHPYGASKAAADVLLRAGADRLRRHLTIIRPFSFTGLHDGGDRLFPSLLRAAQDRVPLALSPGHQLRDFCAVQDVAEGIGTILELSTEPARNIINLGSGRSVSLREIVTDVCQQLALPVDLHFGELPYHPHEPMHLVADIRRAEALGWKPRTNLAYAVWQLARTMYPTLEVKEPPSVL